MALSRDCKHHVFPSFHGEDVRRGLLGCLLKEFKEKGIDVFIDNDIERNRSIGPELITAIRGSMIATVLISKNYASSTWCLDELVEIMKCRKEQIQTTMVLFYEVEPTHVKKQLGYFGTVFKKTCIGKTEEEVERWKQALQEVAQIAGYDSLKWDNDALIAERIATDISNMLNDSIASNDFEGLVGVENHIEKMEDLLSLDSNEVRMVGIWGPAGIGKTTIARALYKKLKNQFTHHAFIDSIKGKFDQKDEHAFKLYLQEQLLSKVLKQKDLKIDNLDVAKVRLKHKKVLIVLDDVDDLTHLEAMSNETCWFGLKSRIIITTKDKHLLKAHGIKHVYNVDYPSESEALEILCQSAFGQNSPPLEFEDMADEVTYLAGNLPLGLSVFGAYLRGMSKDEWTHTLPRLRTSLDGKIEKVLRFSYDALCDKDQELFLHIACFFKGEHISDVVECLESRLNVKHGLKVLCDRSFISKNEWDGRLVVHNLLEQLGKEIVRRQSVSDPGKRQFLLDAEEISDVLLDNTGTKSILGIDLDLSEIREDIFVDEKAFEEMSRLQFIRFKTPWYLDSKAKLVLPQGMKFKGNKLRFLQWDECPMTMLPREFHPRFLVKLEMQNSKLENLWEEPIPLPCLKKMNLYGSKYLKKLPNLSKATNLEVLTACYCSRLVDIPSTIGQVTSLQELNLLGCSSLVVLPSSIWSLNRLENLGIVACSKLKYLGSQLITSDISAKITKLDMSYTDIEEFPSSITTFSCLRYLSTTNGKSLKVFPDVPASIKVLILHQTLIEEVPSSIQNLSSLTNLSMRECEKLKILPSNINLESLTYLDLRFCTQLKTFPEISTSIVYLNLSNTAIEEVPSSIQNLSSLTKLSMHRCEKLNILPSNINLESLTYLDLSSCTQLKTFPEISTSIEYLYLSNTAIETVPSTIWSWFSLMILHLEDCKSLVSIGSVKETDSLDIFSDNHLHIPLGLTKLNLEDCRNVINIVDSIDEETSRAPLSIKLKGCKNLVSLPHLPYYVRDLDAAGCELLQRVDGFSTNPVTCLNFGNCFSLNQEAKELISNCKLALLPGKELLGYFRHKDQRDFLTINLEDQRPLPLFLRYKACLLLVHDQFLGFEDYTEDDDKMLSCCIWGVHNGVNIGYGSCKYYLPAILGWKEHLCFSESSISVDLPVDLSELVFEFKITGQWRIKECGVKILEDALPYKYVDCGDISNGADFADIMIKEQESESKKQRQG